MIFLPNDILILVLIMIGIIIYLRNYNVSIIVGLLICLILLFFRKPHKIIIDDSKIISPAEGKIIKVVKNKDRYTISIFLSLFDKHIQVAPISGKIVKMSYFKGEFNAAHFFEKSNYNERLEIYIKNNINTIKITDYAGMLVRRIEKLTNVGDTINQGDFISIIKFGSRVDIEIPSNYSLLVKENDYLNIGDTICEVV